MKKIHLISTVVFLLFNVIIFAQEAKKESTQESIMEKFLGLDCPQGREIETRINKELIENSPEAEAYFKSLIEKGPDPSWLENEKKNAKRLFEIRTAFDANSKREITFEGDSFDNELAPLKSQEDYISERVNAYRLNLTVRAMEGLRILNTSSSLAYLSQKAADENFPLQELAEELSR